MYTRCVFCHAALPQNQTLEHFRPARKVAFDPERGRLWSICPACGRWNLAPIEERWEALDELERLAADRARLLSKTDHIALLRVEDLELVRVGAAPLAEEAWWRYGRDLLRRRRRSRLVQGAEVVAVGVAAVLTVGFEVFFFYGGESLGIATAAARWWKFGSVAWRGRTACPRCGREQRKVRFDETGALTLAADGDAGVALHLRCPWCERPGDDSVHTITGVAAEHLLRRSLAWQHFHGASEQRIAQATRAIQEAGSVQAVTRTLANRRMKLSELEKRDRTHAIALEIAVNEERERTLLGLELAELERRWKEEEEIAAIADRELSFLPGLDRLLGR